jgi:hypothetical protein
VGALKLSNLLQPDRFEEDLHISRVALSPPKPPKTSHTAPPPLTPEEREVARQRGLEMLARFRKENGG